jgi:hypothetical protein
MIEKDCTIEHEGRKFTVGGAYIGDNHGLVYLNKREGLWRVTDWHGNVLGTVKSYSKGPVVWGPKGVPYYMAYVRLDLDGREWFGRYAPESGEAVRIRAVKRPKGLRSP